MRGTTSEIVQAARRAGERARGLELELAQQVLRDRQPVGRRSAHVADRREVLRERGGRAARTSRSFHGCPDQRRLAGARALRRRRHAAERDPRGADRAAVELDCERGADRRDVLVEALGDLVGRAAARRRVAAARAPRSTNSPGCEGRLLVGEIEVLERQLAPRRAPAQHDASRRARSAAASSRRSASRWRRCRRACRRCGSAARRSGASSSRSSG